MQSREKILAAVGSNQPAAIPMPELPAARQTGEDLVLQFKERLSSIGGEALLLKKGQLATWYHSWSADKGKSLCCSGALPDQAALPADADPHSFADLGLLVLDAHFAVAENGAVWLTEDLMKHRVLPFICEHLLVVLPPNAVLADMHAAYERIDKEGYGFGCFIAGPSKTADIEQSLVLGAHGPQSMTVVLLED